MTDDPKWSKLEMAKVQELYDKYGKQTTYSAAEFLDMREEFEKLRDLEDPENKFKNLKNFAAKVYDDLSKFGRAQLPWLEEADEEHEENLRKVKRLKGLKKAFFKEDGNPRPESGKEMEYAFHDHESVLVDIFGAEKYNEILEKIKIIKALEDIEKAEKRFKSRLPYVFGSILFIILARHNGLTLGGNIDYILAAICFVLIFKRSWTGSGLFGFVSFILSGYSFDWLIFGFLLGFILTWPRISIPLIEKFGKFLGKSHSESTKK